MGGFDWIIDVLADIEEFAQVKNLPEISKKAAIAIVVATSEIGQHPKEGLATNSAQAC